MDSFVNLAKQGYEAYQTHHDHSRSEASVTGGAHYNTPHHSQQDTHSQKHSPEIDDDQVVRNASKEGSGSADLFSSALGFLNQNKEEHHEPIDEEEVQNAHKAAYERGSASNLTAKGMGSAAALQAFKMFTSSKSSGGGSHNQLISMAMAEATKLFDRSGGAASGNKQDAVNGAAMTVMKLMAQSKMSGIIGGGDSGGLSGLMGMASKLL